MVTKEQFEEALGICLEYQMQQKRISDKVYEDMKRIRIKRVERNYSKLDKKTQFKYLKGVLSKRLLTHLREYSECFSIKMETLSDLSEVNVEELKKYNGIGDGTIEELILIKKVLKIE